MSAGLRVEVGPRFGDPALEAAFRSEFAREALRPTRLTIAIVMAMFAAWLVVDRMVFPEYASTLRWVRLVTIAALGSALAATTKPRLYRRARAWIVGVAATAAGASLVFMATLAPAEIGATFYTGIGLTIIGTCTLFLLHVPAAALISVIQVALWEAGSRAFGLPGDTVVLARAFLLSALVLGLLATWVIERFARAGFLARRALDDERARSETLLLNILPAPVAERLKREPAPIADRHPEASVLFADIADFTLLSSSMAPEELVGMLNEVFTEFDRVAAAHGIEKIKTIGDAYMAVAGLPAARPDHLEAVADAALAMRDAVRGSRGVGRPLAVRIGIDTGPVVAGVIGASKFIYDLWGDPVTTASRMESHGVAGEIQVTAAVAERLGDRYVLRPRGEVEIKGKGPMAVWLLEGRQVPRRGSS